MAIIITYNPEMTRFRKLVGALRGQVTGIVISDNGSKNIEEISRVAADDAVVLRLGKNYGIGYAQNRGVEYALRKWRSAKWILMLDHDSIVAKNGLKILLSAYERLDSETKRTVGFVALDPVKDQSLENARFIDASRYQASGNVIKREIFDRDGVRFREDFFMDFVDVEFDLQLKKRGYEMIVYNTKLLDHKLGVPVRRGGKVISYYKGSRLYYFTRNTTYVTLREGFSVWDYFAGLLTIYYHSLLVSGWAGVLPSLNVALCGIADGLLGRMGERNFS